MASVLDLYGIKEVADVTFYEVGTNVPVLYLDSLKVTTIEETASQSSARGGKGNSELIIWDFGKEITLNIEDALFSMKSMALMHGGHTDASGNVVLLDTTSSVQKSGKFTATASGASGIPSAYTSANAIIYDPDNSSAVNSTNVVSGKTYLASWSETISGENNTVTISAKDFPGTYKVVGDTFARGTDGKDSFFQFVVPQAKMSAEKTITMQADGDPSTFSMTLKVTRPDDGNMLKLIKY